MRRLRLRISSCGLLLLLSIGCSGAESSGAEGSGTLDTGSDSTTTTASTSASTTSESVDDTLGVTSVDPTGGSFLILPELGIIDDCDVFDQTCPAGEKCTLWANDGGSTWNATTCVPVAEDPAEVDQPCQVERSSASGIDDCDFGLICSYVDVETLEGICMPLCMGDPTAPQCEDPNRACAVVVDGGLGFCRPICNPLQPGCLEGHACYSIEDTWQCDLDASGELGAYGDACAFANACDPGLVCASDEAVPPGEACEGAGGCCTEVCDLADPAGDLQCAGAAEGQLCLPWYGEGGGAPAGYENVGVCALPA